MRFRDQTAAAMAPLPPPALRSIPALMPRRATKRTIKTITTKTKLLGRLDGRARRQAH